MWDGNQQPQDSDAPDYIDDSLPFCDELPPVDTSPDVSKHQTENAAEDEATLEVVVSLFPDHFGKQAIDVPLEDLIGWQQGGDMPVATVKSHLFRKTPRAIAAYVGKQMADANGDDDRVRAVKAKLPAYTPASRCRGKRSKETVESATGLAQLDFDKIGDDATDLMQSLFNLQYTYLAAISASGSAVMAFCRLQSVPDSDDEYAAQHAALCDIVRDDLGDQWAHLFDEPVDKEKPHCDRSVDQWEKLRYVTDGRDGRMKFRANPNAAPTLDRIYSADAVEFDDLDLEPIPQETPQVMDVQVLDTGNAAANSTAIRRNSSGDEAQDNLDDIKMGLDGVSCAGVPEPDWFKVGGALKRAEADGRIPAGTGFNLWESWSATDPKRYAENGDGKKSLPNKWAGFKTSGRSAGFRWLMHEFLIGQHGFVRPKRRPPKNTHSHVVGGDQTQQQGHVVDELMSPQSIQANHETLANRPLHWVNMGEHGPKTKSIPNSEVACLYMAQKDGKLLRYNEFNHDYYIDDERVGNAALDEFQSQLERETNFLPSDVPFLKGFGNICRQTPFHPIREYLLALEWDGKKRLATLGERYFATEENNELQNAIAALLIDGMVGRVMVPGTKFDYLIVIHSERQGMGKGESLKRLAGEWYRPGFDLADHAPERRLMEHARNAWLLEFDELEGFTKADMGRMKGMVTRTSDVARMVYERKEEERQRQFVMVGTTNELQFLGDRQNRRFPVLRVGGPIDVDGLETDRDQIFAEAMARRDQLIEGHIFLPKHLWGKAEEASKESRVVSDAEEFISEWIQNLADPTFFTSSSLRKAIQDEGMRVNEKEKGRVLSFLGYVNARKWNELNQQVRGWKLQEKG